MKEMTAYCGIVCSDCGAYLATVNDDDAKREEVAKQWSEAFGADIKPADINCAGCTSDGPPLFHHATVCEIRKCSRGRGLANCAHCDEYACDSLDEFFKMVPDAKARLDSIRSGL